MTPVQIGALVAVITALLGLWKFVSKFETKDDATAARALVTTTLETMIQKQDTALRTLNEVHTQTMLTNGRVTTLEDRTEEDRQQSREDRARISALERQTWRNKSGE